MSIDIILFPLVANGRLTLESGVPISTSDQTAKTTIYYAPTMEGNRLALYTGSAWRLYTFAQLSLALGTLTSGANYDVFAYDNSGTLTLELSAAWTNATTRSEALTTQDGIYVKSGALTRRYLGTIRTTSTTTTEDSAAKRFVWNLQNRNERRIAKSEDSATTTWTYSTNTWRAANGDSDNRVEVVCGLAISTIDVLLAGMGRNTSAGVQVEIAIGEDSASSPSADCVHQAAESASTNNTFDAMMSRLVKTVALGYHYYQWIENGGSSGTTTFYGTSAVANGEVRMGLMGKWQC